MEPQQEKEGVECIHHTKAKVVGGLASGPSLRTQASATPCIYLVVLVWETLHVRCAIPLVA